MSELDASKRIRVAQLLVEFRGWHPGVPEATLEALAEKFELPELVVRRLADSEGFELTSDPSPRRKIDPNSTTQPIHIEPPDDS